MTTTETVSLIIAGAAVLTVLVLVGALLSLRKTIRELQAVSSQVRDLLPLASELRSSITDARGEIEKLGSVTKRAENITATVDSASQLAYLAFSNPVIKSMAAGAGVTRAYKALRRNRKESAAPERHLGAGR
jgi:hypothetical protein